MNVPTPTFDQVADAMVAQLDATMLAPPTGVTVSKPLRFVKRFMGETFTKDDFSRQGGAGRTPGVFVAFAGERTLRTTISRRRDKVEASFSAICVSDLHRNKDDRKVVLETIYGVRQNLGARGMSFGLSMMPLRYSGIEKLIESDQLHAYAARFITRYHVDYTVNPGNDVITDVDGSIVYPADPSIAGPAPAGLGLALVGAPGAAQIAYEVQALYGTNPRSDWSLEARIKNAAAVLDATHKVTVTWAAAAGATGYRLRRRWGGPSQGVIYTGALLTFTDDGSVAGDGNVLPERGLNLDGDF
jgi:hypothetical protein